MKKLSLLFRNLIVVVIAGCSSGVSDVTERHENEKINSNKFSAPIPQEISEHFNNSNDVTAELRINDNLVVPLPISWANGVVSADLGALQDGDHEFQLNFYVIRDDVNFLVATSSDSVAVASGRLQSVDLGNFTFPDDDNDGDSNLLELINSTNPFAGVKVSDISGATTEDGGQATFTVVLTSNPSADVNIPVNSSDISEGIVAPDMLIFSESDWNSPKIVTVTGVNDDIADGDVQYTVNIASVISSDTNFNGLDPRDVVVLNTDNDLAEFTISAISGNTTEEGVSATFSVALSSQPVADVAIGISSSNSNEGIVDVTELIFTPDNWSTPQIVTVTGVNDDVADGNQTYTILLATAQSDDAQFNGQNPPDVTVVNVDDDSPGFNVSPISGNTSESGNSAIFTVQLTTQPTAEVVIELSSSNVNEATINKSIIRFDSDNWNIAQTVTVTGVDDDIRDGNRSLSIILTGAVSGDSNYNGRKPNNVSVVNVDNEPIPTIILSVDKISITEEADSTLATVTSNVASTQEIVVNIAFSGDAKLSTDYTVSSSSISIAPGSKTGSISISSIQDGIDEADESIVLDISSITNANEASVQQATVIIVDDDQSPTVTLSINTSSPLPENGGTANVIATLSEKSGRDVVVNLQYSGTALAGIDYVKSDTITIPAGNTLAQSTITAVDDALDEIVENIIIDIGSVQNGIEVTTQQVSASIVDDDVPIVQFEIVNQVVSEGDGIVTILLTLDRASVADVSVLYSVAGSATFGADHDLVGGELVIPEGQISGMINFNILDDTLAELDEVIVVTLTNSTDADLGNSTTHTIVVSNNSPPIVEKVSISGILPLSAGTVLTGKYFYQDEDSDVEGSSTYRWYKNNMAIPGANSISYTLKSNDIAQSIQFEVTPLAQTGIKLGKPGVSPPGVNIRKVGESVGGNPQAIAIQGNLAYVAASGIFSIFDISIPENLDQLTYFDTPGVARDVVIQNNHAFLATREGGVRVLNVTNLSEIVEVSAFGVGLSPHGIAISGNFAFVADYNFGLRIYDISNISMPVEIGVIDTPNLALKVALHENFAYVADERGGIVIIDISNPASPMIVNSYTPVGHVNDVEIHGNFMYVPASSSGLIIIDISNPNAFVEVGTFQKFGFSAHSVRIRNNIAYVAAGAGGLQLIDISDPNSPTEISAVDTPGYSVDLAIDGNFAFVADNYGGLLSIDISDASFPLIIGNYDVPGLAFDLKASGTNIYIAEDQVGLKSIDISDPPNPLVNKNTNKVVGNAYSVDVSGNFAYIVGNELQIFDIGTPKMPVLVGSTSQLGSSTAVAVSGNIAYTVSFSGTQNIIDISNPSFPAKVWQMKLNERFEEVTLSGNFAYLANSSSGMRIMDFSNPSAPLETGLIDTPGVVLDIAVVNSFAYVADASGGLRIIDVSVKTAPIEVGFIDTIGTATGVFVENNYAYVADGEKGLRVIDISNPATPKEVGFVDTPGTARKVVVHENKAYVADYLAGIEIYEFINP